MLINYVENNFNVWTPDVTVQMQTIIPVYIIIPTAWLPGPCMDIVTHHICLTGALAFSGVSDTEVSTKSRDYNSVHSASKQFYKYSELYHMSFLT